MDCQICGNKHIASTLTFPGGLKIDLCGWCYEDEGKVIDWLARELETAMASSPDYERLPDGSWTKQRAI